MLEGHLTNIADLDVVTFDRGGLKWMEYNSSVNLNNFEKIHSGGSSGSYFIPSIFKLIQPVHMGLRRQEFFQSLLDILSDELLFSARAPVARLAKED